MAGIVHFSVFFAYMEEAEHELLRSVGLGVFLELDGERYSWPRVSAHCDFHKPARYQDLLEISTCISRIGRSSLTFQHEFHCRGAHLASGSITTVCCMVAADHKLQASATPHHVVEALKRYLKDEA